MDNFEFYNPTRIIFGKDTEQQVGKAIPKNCKNILLHYGSERIKKNGLYDSVMKSLNVEGFNVFELGGVVANPRLEMVREGIALCKEKEIDFILAVGGGSVIDSAKAIAMGAVTDKDVWTFYMREDAPTDALPIGTVLTIPAAGSESSNSTVVSDEKSGRKLFVQSVLLYPKFSVLNPVLTMSLPDYQTACGASDMLAHVMERYFTNTKHVEFTDRLCEATMKTIIDVTPRLLMDSKNYDLRAEIMWSGTIAHNGILNTGRLGDWATHQIEHEVSAVCDVAHGAGLAIVFPAWMKYNYEHDLARFHQFAKRVFCIKTENAEQAALEAIAKLEEFYHTIKLTTQLRDLEGLKESDIDHMATQAVSFGPIGQFVNLEKADVVEILKLCW